MGNGAFQTLIVAGLFLLIAAVIFLAVLVIRRGRGGAAAVSDYSRASLASRPESGTGSDMAGQTERRDELGGSARCQPRGGTSAAAQGRDADGLGSDRPVGS